MQCFLLGCQVAGNQDFSGYTLLKEEAGREEDKKQDIFDEIAECCQQRYQEQVLHDRRSRLSGGPEEGQLPTHVPINSATHPSTALCEQVQTVSKDRLGRCIGAVSDKEME